MCTHRGANARAADAAGVAALHYCCYSATLNVAAARALLRAGADPCMREFTYGCTPLHYAASSGNVELCTLLLEAGAAADCKDYYDYRCVSAC
jgi:26S proteasome non-ATPase regulatory subunit 10